ncbi:MAG: hypothetical protein SNG10_06015 [Rikenellaceae bacterium]
MKKYNFLLLLTIFASGSCQKFDENATEIISDGVSMTRVEMMEDGRLRVTASLNGVSMTSVSTKSTNYEDVIYDGWCLVFGENEEEHADTTTNTYTDDSPLIQIEPITVNANGTFFMTFDEYPNASFMRIVVNLTERETSTLESIISWRKVVYAEGSSFDEEDFQTPPTATEVADNGIATFGQYRYQSVGLDGIYNTTYNTTATTSEIPQYEDVSGIMTSWAVIYSNSDSDAITGISSVHNQAESYNATSPNPANVRNCFPMASYGFIMESISEQTLQEMFDKEVDMIRLCSKIQVEVEDSNFSMQELYVIDAAQEARIRSTVLSSSLDEDGIISVSATFGIPEDLGGTITYQPLATSSTLSDPIYFYPNSGGDYTSNDAVNQDTNPQYIIIKGQAAGYDTPGYYKVALKAQYPLASDSDESNMDDTSKWSALTYDILRNTSFTVKLNTIDKPGYKTFADAADSNSPANNISYSIDIETSNNRYEVLVSKGTYYTELETSRVYIKGYMDSGITGCYIDFTMTPSQGNVVPSVYIQSSDHDGDYIDNSDVIIDYCKVLRTSDNATAFSNSDWDSATIYSLSDNETEDGLSGQLVNIPSGDETTKIRVYFSAYNSGVVRLRIGDILKFIPVVYDRIPISIYGTIGQNGTQDNGVVVTDIYGQSWSDFSHTTIYTEDISNYPDGEVNYFEDFTLNPSGTITHSSEGSYSVKPELRARILPTNAGDGNAVLYLRQASDFALSNSEGEIFEQGDSGDYYVSFTAQGKVWDNNTNGMFSGERGDDNIIFDTSESSSINALSVDGLTINIETNTTSATVSGDFFEEQLSNSNQTLSLYIDKMDYSNQAYTSYSSNFIRNNYTAKSTITVENSAGDYKTYIVEQTQYPPIYLVATEGGSTKAFKMCSSNDINQYQTSVYVISIYNWDGDSSTGSWDCSWAQTTGKSMTTSHYNYFLGVIYEVLLDKDYLDNYDYTNDYKTNYQYYGYKAYTDARSSFTRLDEFEDRGGTTNADSAFTLMRNYDELESDGLGIITTNYSDVYATLSITIKDQYGETYTTTKNIQGMD